LPSSTSAKNKPDNTATAPGTQPSVSVAAGNANRNLPRLASPRKPLTEPATTSSESDDDLSETGQHTSKKTKKHNESPSRWVHMRPFHYTLPQQSIDTNTSPWYWNFNEVPIEDAFAPQISISDVNSHLASKLSKLIFTVVALSYADQTNITSGDPLLQILTQPNHTNTHTEKLHWNSIFKKHNDLCTRAVLHGATIHRLDHPLNPASKTFLSYFNDVIANKYPVTIHDQDVTEALDDSNASTSFACYWTLQDIDSLADFNRSTLLRSIHDLTCSVVFDNAVRDFFLGRSKKLITAAVFNLDSQDTVYPPSSNLLKIQWEQEFHFAVHSLTTILLSAPDSQSYFTDVPRTTTFIQALVNYTYWLGTQLHSTMAPVPLPNVPPSNTPRPSISALPLQHFDSSQQLRQLFFRHDGSLRRDLQSNIDFAAPNHGFVRFKHHETTDLRYFIPFFSFPLPHEGTSSQLSLLFLLILTSSFLTSCSFLSKSPRIASSTISFDISAPFKSFVPLLNTFIISVLSWVAIVNNLTIPSSLLMTVWMMLTVLSCAYQMRLPLLF
jgi:hypothetical protein